MKVILACSKYTLLLHMKTLVRLLAGITHDLPDDLLLRMLIRVFKTARFVDWMWTAKFKPARNAKDVWPDGNNEVRNAKCELQSAQYSRKWGGEPRSTKYRKCATR